MIKDMSKPDRNAPKIHLLPDLSRKIYSRNIMTADSKSDYVPELIYHVKRSIIDFAVDPSGSTQTTDILSTFTDLTAAKAAAHTALLQEGYLKKDFAKYEENNGTEKWKHEDATMVIARAPAGQEFKVSLDTTLNKFPFRVDHSSKVIDHLEYGSSGICYSQQTITNIFSSSADNNLLQS